MHRAVLLVLVAVIGVSGTALLATGCGTAASSAREPSPSPTEQPPAWLLEDMSREARNCGDPNASAWWTLTTSEKAVVVEEGDDPSHISNPDGPVYVYVIHGDFARWLWSLPPGASAPTYSWVVVMIDAKSRMTDVVGNSDKGFDTTGLAMQSVVLPASAPSIEPTTSASNVSGSVMLRLPQGEKPGSGLVVTAHSAKSDAPSAITRTGSDGSFQMQLKPGWYLLTVGYWGEPAMQVHVTKIGTALVATISAPSKELAAMRTVKVNQVPTAPPPHGVRIGANVLLEPPPAHLPRPLVSKAEAIRLGGGAGPARAVLAVVTAPGVRIAPKPLADWLAWVVVRRMKRPFDAVIGGPGIPRPACLVLNGVSLIDARTGKFLLGFFTR